MIKVTGIDMVKLVQEAYNSSIPQGLGFLHFTHQPLTEDEARELIDEEDDKFPVQMDYVKGRSVKLTLFKKGDDLFLDDYWYDHTDDQYRKLLSALGVKNGISKGEHGVSCNCVDCREKILDR